MRAKRKCAHLFILFRFRFDFSTFLFPFLFFPSLSLFLFFGLFGLLLVPPLLNEIFKWFARNSQGGRVGEGEAGRQREAGTDRVRSLVGCSSPRTFPKWGLRPLRFRQAQKKKNILKYFNTRFFTDGSLHVQHRCSPPGRAGTSFGQICIKPYLVGAIHTHTHMGLTAGSCIYAITYPKMPKNE